MMYGLSKGDKGYQYFFLNRAVINLLILKIGQNDKEIVQGTGILQI